MTGETEKKIKIAMVAPADNPHTIRFARHFLKAGHELRIVSYSAGEIDNVDIYVHSRVNPESRGIGRKILFMQDYLEIRRILAWADIVFVNKIYNWRFNEVYRGLKNVVAWVWGSDVTYQENETEREAYYKKLILKIARKVIATSRFLAEETKKYLPDGVEAAVIPMGVDTSLFYPSQRKRSDDEPVVIGYAKGLYEKYGPHILMEALAKIDITETNFLCRIAGGGELEVPLKLYAERLGIKQRVEFLGKLPYENIPDFMREIDIFVMPSLWKESFGVAALEASATGIPVIASDIGGIPEVVWTDETGLLVPPGDPTSLADAISTLINEEDIRNCMGRQGRDFVRNNYTWDVTIKALGQVFEDVLRETGRI